MIDIELYMNIIFFSKTEIGTSKLWQNREDAVVSSELWWRVFVPFAMFVALILALALSEVSPRQGRYLKLFPALLIFASLIVVLMAIKTRISKDELGAWAYPVALLLYGGVGILFLRKPNLAPKIKQKIQRVGS